MARPGGKSPLPDGLFEAMSRREFYPHRPDSVSVVQTHISVVFLAGDLVYKVKKPVDFGFLDYSTLRRRGIMCRREVALNGRLAPGLYLGVAKIRRQDGAWSLSSPGRVAEYAVVMRRVPGERLLSTLLARGKATLSLARRIGRWLAAFHAAAAPAAARNRRLSVLRKHLDENFRQTAAYIGRTVTARDYRFVYDYNVSFLADRGALLRRRRAQGRIRDCHGDLHSEHIFLSGRGIAAYDCIEFSSRLRQTDTAAEVAFLYMDLLYHRHPHLARAFAEEYISASGDWEMRLLIPFYACYRAVVREKVESLRFSDPAVPPGQKAEARRRASRYFHLARDLAAADGRPRLIAVGGLPGSGKSTFARLLAESLGARCLNSDVLRKALAGLAPRDRGTAPWGGGIYAREWTRRTYKALAGAAGEALAAGRSVVLDATFSRRWQRRLAAAAARDGGARFVAVECRCPERLVRARLTHRGAGGGGVSDADWSVYRAMKAACDPPDRGTLIVRTDEDQERGLAAVAAAAFPL